MHFGKCSVQSVTLIITLCVYGVFTFEFMGQIKRIPHDMDEVFREMMEKVVKPTEITALNSTNTSKSLEEDEEKVHAVIFKPIVIALIPNGNTVDAIGEHPKSDERNYLLEPEKYRKDMDRRFANILDKNIVLDDLDLKNHSTSTSTSY